MIGSEDLLLWYFLFNCFPYKDQIESIYCNGLLYVFPACQIVSFLINFTFLTSAWDSDAWPESSVQHSTTKLPSHTSQLAA